MTPELTTFDGTDPHLVSNVRRDEVATHSNPVFQAVLNTLKQRIYTGEWLPGERLPSITKLARELEVSTGSLREVLRSLQSMRLVKIEHGRGIFVIGSYPSTDISSHFQDMNIGLIIALAETRRILEPELAALAAERGSPSELDEIALLAKQMDQEAKQGLDFVRPDMQFHRHIAQAAHNPVLYRLMESADDLLLESYKVTSVQPGMTERAVRYHMLIAEALRDRNPPQARLLMLAHMNDVLNNVLRIDEKAIAEGF